MNTALRIGLTLLLASMGCMGADVTPFLANEQLGVRIARANYPETLHKDLTSGLTNTLLIRLTLLADTQVLQQRTATLNVKYDLWDENFTAGLVLDGTTVDTRTYGKLADITAALSQLKLPAMFRAAEVPAARALTMRAEILLNPVDRERMEKIRKWVAENSADAHGVGTLSPVGTTDTIFNRIFEQYAAGANVAATWSEQGDSKPFRLHELPP